MSQELQFVEVEGGDWFYILEERGAPKDAWDWMDYAEAFGPFKTYEEACDHEYRSRSDTSGSEIVTFASGRVSASALTLIEARQRKNAESAR